MAQSKPPIIKLSELVARQTGDFFAQLSNRSQKTPANGSPFYVCTFRDAKRSMSAVVWHGTRFYHDCETSWQIGQFFKLRAKLIDSLKYGLQLEIENIRSTNDGDAADGFDKWDLLSRSRFDADAMFNELQSLASAEISDIGLRTLVTQILISHGPDLRLLPGSAAHYYPFAGGWLEHTLSVTKNCMWLADKYREQYCELKPPLNRDIIVAAAILHDLGRVVELQQSVGSEKTVRGQLLGHLMLGRDLVRDAARTIEGLDGELLLLLEHVLISYLALPEWGSPRLPAVPEVLILHHADDLDAKMQMFASRLMMDIGPGPFTEKDAILGKALWKARKQ